MQTKYLALPGPTSVDNEVLKEMASEVFNHRGKEFSKILANLTAKTQQFLNTKNELHYLTASGTGAMECAIVNSFSKGDKVLALINGAFGQRYADIAKSYGLDVIEFYGKWGQSFDYDKLKETVENINDLAGITVIQGETSTGVVNDLKKISEIKNDKTLLIVDGISSIGAENIDIDGWGIDVVITGSQKVLALPPGLAIICLSKKALEAYRQSDLPKYYWDIGKYKKFTEIGQTPYTPAISLIKAAEKQIEKIANQGMDSEVKRHETIANMVREGIKALGLELFNEKGCRSNVVTPIKPPEGIKVSQIRKLMLDKYKVEVAGGQGKLKESVFRIGHLGNVDPLFVISVLTALEMSLIELGHNVKLGTAVTAAQKALCNSK
ncbi:alanine--glyoxylate aminotransferase family protein [Proteinivorax hydrogeniformans]|uniref:Tritium exchange subunit n=1 Tax=Proteinivorax hydrogeniformans TaxID=1826727 RepID=A0AAU8HTU4_9FIRM